MVATGRLFAVILCVLGFCVIGGKLQVCLEELLAAAFCFLGGVVIWLYTRPTRLLEVDGRAVLITGCDTGFGHALAIRLDRLGFRVFAGCLFKGGEGERKLVQVCSERLTTIQLDVTDQQQVDDALGEVQAHLDGNELWGLVNNAGMMFIAEFQLSPMSEIERQIQVNCLGTLRVTKAFCPLIRRSRGRIVNVSSVSGKVAFELHAAYSASKAAIELFSDSLRMELKPWEVHVSLILPAGFQTGLMGETKIEAMLRSVEGEISPRLKAEYGEEYLAWYRQRVTRLSKGGPYILSDLSSVVDAMVDALRSTDPKPRYVVGKGARLMLFVRHFLPTKMADRIFARLFCRLRPLPAAVRERKGR